MAQSSLEFPDDLGDDGEDCEGPSFVHQAVGVDRLSIGRIVGLAAANDNVLCAFQSGEVVRWFPIEDEASKISFGGAERCGDISRVFLEPKGFHAVITNTSGDSWYLNFQSSQAKQLPKLRSHVIESIAWDPQSTDTRTGDLVMGTMGGHVLRVDIEGREKSVRSLFVFDFGQQMRLAVCGLHREQVVSAADGSERTVLFVAAGCGIYAFVERTLDTLFQRYQGEGGAQRALIYEVPRDSPHGELHVDVACVGSSMTKELFWLTGVGVLTATIKNPLDAENQTLETPPGGPDLISFPRPPRQNPSTRAGASLIASLLPAPPPAAPLSMALTPFHIVFLFEDRWAVVSRISHDVVQQQEWATSTLGVLRGLARDVHGERLYLCSERHVFEVLAEHEDRQVWALLLQREQFDDALAACGSESQRQTVLSRHADWLFRQPGKLEEAARKFAECTTVPFEHAALRFLRPDRKAALLEYLRCRLERYQSECSEEGREDRVPRALLGVWAVEVSLAHLNDLRLLVESAEENGRPGARRLLEAARARFRELLLGEEGRDTWGGSVHLTILHLLQSHGWLEELMLFAERRRDYETVVLHQVMRRDCAGAIQKLSDFLTAGCSDNLVWALVRRFAPLLFGAVPQAFVTMLLSPQLAMMEPLSVLPAVYTPRGSATHRAEAMRYLRHATSRSSERELADPSCTKGLSWATGTALLNALCVLYACDEDGAAGRESATASACGAEDSAIRFFDSQEGGALFDPHFALRVCVERGLTRAVVLLYGIMGMHEEAVDVALQRGDVALAKHNACKPAEGRVRRKLWLRVVESQAASSEVHAILGLVNESKELTVRDVLPFMSSSMTVDAFKPEIVGCLDDYETQILTLRQEMDDHRRALQAFKEDLKLAEERCVVIEEDQACEVCGGPATRERFYAFACQHCFHESCLCSVTAPTLDKERRERLYALEAQRVQHQAATAGALAGGELSAAALAEIEEELDSMIAEDCPLCGRLMIETVTRPFIDSHEGPEAQSWMIR